MTTQAQSNEIIPRGRPLSVDEDILPTLDEQTSRSNYQSKAAYNVSKRPSGELILRKSLYDRGNKISKERRVNLFEQQSAKARRYLQQQYGQQKL